MRGTAPDASRWHLRCVGVAGTFWNLIGVISFVVTQLDVEAVMSGYPPQQRAYFTPFPLWADATRGLGVAARRAGCLLLLFRSRGAVPALVVSLIGASREYRGLLFLGGTDVMRETGGLALTMVAVGVGTALASYACSMSSEGVLRAGVPDLPEPLR